MRVFGPYPDRHFNSLRFSGKKPTADSLIVKAYLEGLKQEQLEKGIFGHDIFSPADVCRQLNQGKASKKLKLIIRRQALKLNFRLVQHPSTRKIQLTPEVVKANTYVEKLRATLLQDGTAAFADYTFYPAVACREINNGEISRPLKDALIRAAQKHQFRIATPAQAIQVSWEDPEIRNRREKALSEPAKKSWENPTIRQRREIGINTSLQKPETKQKKSGAARKAWENPEIRQRYLQAMQDPETIQKARNAWKKALQKPEVLQKVLASLKKASHISAKKSSERAKRKHRLLHFVDIRLVKTVPTESEMLAAKTYVACLKDKLEQKKLFTGYVFYPALVSQAIQETHGQHLSSKKLVKDLLRYAKTAGFQTCRSPETVVAKKYLANLKTEWIARGSFNNDTLHPWKLAQEICNKNRYLSQEKLHSSVREQARKLGFKIPTQSEITMELWKTTAVREKMTEANRKTGQRLDVRQKRSKFRTKVLEGIWANPVERKKMQETLNKNRISKPKLPPIQVHGMVNRQTGKIIPYADPNAKLPLEILLAKETATQINKLESAFELLQNKHPLAHALICNQFLASEETEMTFKEPIPLPDLTDEEKEAHIQTGLAFLNEQLSAV